MLRNGLLFMSTCLVAMGLTTVTQANPIDVNPTDSDPGINAENTSPLTAPPSVPVSNSNTPRIYPFGVPGVLPPGIYPPGTTAIPTENPHPNVQLGPGVRIGPGVLINGKPATDPLVDKAIKSTLQDPAQ